MSPKLINKYCLSLDDPYIVQPTNVVSGNDQSVDSEDTLVKERTESSLQILDPFNPAKFPELVISSEAHREKCKWVRDVPAYKVWIERSHRNRVFQSDDSLRLWLSGGPGTGKTSLSAFIIKDLQSKCVLSENHARIQILYFHCHRPYQTRNSASAVLKGLLYQLIKQRPDLTTDFCDWLCRYENRARCLNNAVVVWNLLRCALGRDDAGTTYCIVDGLHECDEKSIEVLTELFSRPFPLEGCLGNLPALKILVTCRGAINLKRYGKIDLDEQHQSESDLVSELTSIREHLNDMERRAMCDETLETIAAYWHPPTTGQLQSFFEESSDRLQQRLQLCERFVKTDTTNEGQFIYPNTWHEVSQSSKAHAKLARECLVLISQKLTPIDMEDFEEEASKWFDKMTFDVRYAVLYWAEHVKHSLDTSEDLLDLIMDTFTRNSLTVEKWWIAYHQMHYCVSQQNTTRHHHTTVLHLLAFFGLHAQLLTAGTSGRWSRLEKYMETKDCLQQDPLTIAIVQNHTETAEFLVTNGANIDSTHTKCAASSNAQLAKLVFSRYNGERIPRASMDEILTGTVLTGNEDLLSHTIAFLKRFQTKQAIPLTDFRSLRCAIETGQDHLLKPILEITFLKATTVEAIIEYAVDFHEEIILAKLLEMPEIRDVITREKLPLLDSLIMALEHKCPLMVNKLMSDKNINARDGRQQTPLQCAVNSGNIQTLCQFLSNEKFSFDHGFIEEGVALYLLLHNALVQVDISYLEKVLDRGARMQYAHFGITALHVAAEIGRTEVMQVLLEKMTKKEIMAEIDLQPSSHHGPGRDQKTALAIAAAKGHHEIVKLLLLKGAKIDIRDRGKTVMDLAKDGGHSEVVKIPDVAKVGGRAALAKEEKEEKLEVGEATQEAESEKQDETGKGNDTEKSKEKGKRNGRSKGKKK